MELRIDPGVLEAAAEVCGDLRDRVRASAVDIEPETEAAIAGLAGWRTRGALQDLLSSWQEDLTKLTGYLKTFSDALAGCAMDYRYSDVANAARFDIRGR